MTLSLNGKVAVVTGAASGMGLATARALAAAGAKVYGADISAEALDRDFAAIEGSVAAVVDVSSSESVNALFAQVAEEHGKLDILINVAGISLPNKAAVDWMNEINANVIDAFKNRGEYAAEYLEGIPDADWDRVFAINVTGSFYTMRAAAPLLKAAGGGSIVNFSSVAGLIPMAMPAYYPASKAALVGLTKSAAVELAPFDIRVNAIAPAGINSPMFTAAGPDFVDFLLAAQPLKRVADPTEVAGLVAFLCTDEGHHLTGQVLSPSGGALMVS